jgi:predicted RNA binding protein YcfA (HicA-like mRNA interferase family)
VSQKQKLLERLKGKPKNFTWDEVLKLMAVCGFRLVNKSGSARMFVHEATRVKVRLHEPHPQPTLFPYMVDQLIEGLRAAGEME